jgi:hypothetical protein
LAILMTVLAGILDRLAGSGLRPMRALRFWTTSFTMPGSTNSPARLSSFSDSVVSSSKNSRACVRLTSKRSAKCENSSDLPILRASTIGYSPCMGALSTVSATIAARADRARVRWLRRICKAAGILLAPFSCVNQGFLADPPKSASMLFWPVALRGAAKGSHAEPTLKTLQPQPRT